MVKYKCIIEPSSFTEQKYILTNYELKSPGYLPGLFNL